MARESVGPDLNAYSQVAADNANLWGLINKPNVDLDTDLIWVHHQDPNVRTLLKTINAEKKFCIQSMHVSSV